MIECEHCPVIDNCKRINRKQERESCCFGTEQFNPKSGLCFQCGWRESCEIIAENSKVVVIRSEGAVTTDRPVTYTWSKGKSWSEPAPKFAIEVEGEI